MQLLSIILFIALLSVHIQAQNYMHRQFLNEDGLPGSSILDIEQDSLGFIWIATVNGLARFDGITFQRASVQNDFADQHITNIQQTTAGHLWAVNKYQKMLSRISHMNYTGPTYQLKATINSRNLQILHRKLIVAKGNEVSVYQLNDSLSLDTTYELSATVNTIQKYGDSLYITTNAGLYLYHNTSLKSFYEKQLAKKALYGIYVEQGKIYLSSKNELYILEDEQLTTIPIPVKDDQIIEYLVAERNGKIWFTVLGKGLWLWDQDSLRSVNTILGISDVQISGLYKDDDEHIWVGTLGEGLFYLKPNPFRNFTSDDGLVHNYVNAFTEKQDTLIIGTYNGLSLYKQGVFHNIKCNYYPGVCFVYALKAGKQLVAGINGSDTLLRIHDGRGKIQFVNATAMAEINDHQLLMGNWSNTLFTFNTHTGAKHRIVKLENEVSQSRINKIVPAGENIWIGDSRRLYRYGKQGISLVFEKGINDMVPIDNKLLLATNNGLFSYNTKTEEQLAEVDLIGEIVNCLLLDGQQELWIGTANGLYHKHHGAIRYYNTADGLVNDEVLSLYKDQTGQLWIGTSGGLSLVQKQDELAQTGQPRLYLNFIATDDTTFYADTKTIQLRHDQNSISLHISGIYYQNPSKLEIEYRMNRGAWRTVSGRQLVLAELDYGRHQLWIRGRIPGGEWLSISRELYISPPIWETWYFKIISTALFAAVLVLSGRWMYRRSVRKEIEKQRIQNKITFLRQQAVSSLLNPHFIFNAMNSIQLFVNKNKTSVASDYLARFARLIRLNMLAVQKQYITVADELERLQIYLELEQLRFEQEKLSYEIICNTDCKYLLIPSMIIQPFVENAIWHGIMPAKKPGKVTITISKHGKNKIEIIIEDNGIGISQTKRNHQKGHISQGMSLIRQRLELLFSQPSETQLQIEDRSNIDPGKSGTRVRINFPFKLKSTIHSNFSPSQ